MNVYRRIVGYDLLEAEFEERGPACFEVLLEAL